MFFIVKKSLESMYSYIKFSQEWNYTYSMYIIIMEICPLGQKNFKYL